MKICFVCNEYPPHLHGGIGIFVRNLAETLVKLGIDVSVVGYGRKAPQPFEQNGVRVFWLTLPDLLYRKIRIGGFSYSLSLLIKRLILSSFLNKVANIEKFDLIESYDFSGPLAFKPPGKLVVRLHNTVTVMRSGEGIPHDVNPVDHYYEKKQILSSDHIVAVSNHIGFETNRVFKLKLPYDVIYNGVDTDFFCPEPGVAMAEQVLFVGNIMWRKGVFDLLHAVPQVIAQHPSARLLIVGGAGGVHFQQLNDELARMPSNVREQVHLLGYLPHNEMPAIYNRSSVFVFPSRVEAFGLTCVEAMACGRPVVATCLASGPELVENGISGLLADPTDPTDLAEKINTILDDPMLAKKLGTQARQHVLEKFDLRTLGIHNMDYYRSLL